MMIHPVFWAAFFILFGLSIALGALFNISIPFFKLAIAILFMYIGISILMPKSRQPFMSCCHSDKADYTVVFSNRFIDLTTLQPNTDTGVVVVFGSATVKVDQTKPLKIVGNTVFGSITSPEPSEDKIALGQNTYTTKAFNAQEPYAQASITVVFGSVEIISDNK
jgi:hypothetical protein